VGSIVTALKANALKQTLNSGQNIALKMQAVCSSETLVSTYKSHGSTTQKIKIDIFVAVRTSTVTKYAAAAETANAISKL
jgi:hypothetical protein